MVTADYHYPDWGCLVDFFLQSGVEKLLAWAAGDLTHNALDLCSLFWLQHSIQFLKLSAQNLIIEMRKITITSCWSNSKMISQFAFHFIIWKREQWLQYFSLSCLFTGWLQIKLLKYNWAINDSSDKFNKEKLLQFPANILTEAWKEDLVG